MGFFPRLDQIDIYCSAHLPFEKLSKDAVIEAAIKADAKFDKGDLDRHRALKAIV